MQEATGTIAMAAGRLTFDLAFAMDAGRKGALAGAAVLDTDRREVALSDLTITLGRTPWRLVTAAAPPVIAWADAGLSVSPLALASGSGANERIGVSGTWRKDGNGSLRVTATHVSLDAIEGAFQVPAGYGGTLELDATIAGTRQQPIVTSRVEITDGRVRRLAYERLAGRVDYSGDDINIDVRLDQSPGVWINAVGKVPLALFDRRLPERPFDVEITSSCDCAGTDRSRHRRGQRTSAGRCISTSGSSARATIRTSQGTVDISDAAFLVDGHRRALQERPRRVPAVARPRRRRDASTSRTSPGGRSTCAAASAPTSCASATWRST